MEKDTKQTLDTFLQHSSLNSFYEKTNTVQDSLEDPDTDTITEKYSNLTLFNKKSDISINKPDVVTPFQKLPHEIIDSILNQITEQQQIIRNIDNRHRIFWRITMLGVYDFELRKLQGTLYQCTLVSKQFYTISNPLLWQAPFTDYFNGQRLVTCLFDNSSSRQRFKILAQHIRELSLNDSHWKKHHLARLVPCLTHLNHLEIYIFQINFDYSCLIQRMHHLQRITKLKFSESSRLTQEFFRVIGHHCHQLNELELRHDGSGSLEWLSLLIRCPLKSLYIFTLSVPINETLFRTVQQLHLLTAFYMRSNSFGKPQENFLHLVPYNATQWWNQLTRVQIGICQEIDDDSFLGFIRSCPRLEHLDMIYPRLLTDKSFDAMAVHLPQLSHLAWGDNKNITPNAVQRLVLERGDGGGHLEYVKFTNCALLFKCYFTEWALLESSSCFSYIVLDKRAINKIKQYKVEGDNNK